MPTTKTKKETVATETENEKAEVSTQVVDENKMLKEQLAQMQAQMELMAKMITNNTKEKPEPVIHNRAIRFVNLTNGTLVLKGSQFWTIEGRYNYHDFPEKEARLIVSVMNNCIRSGNVYIDNADFVKENDLDILYGTLLSDEDLKHLLDNNATDVIETYKNVNNAQREIIIDVILDAKSQGRKIDSNILVELGELSGRDLLHENPVED